MARRGLHVLAAVAMSLGLAAGPAQADEFTYLASDPVCALGSGNGCGEACNGGCGAGYLATFCGPCGLIAGAEMVLLRPYLGDIRELGVSGQIMGLGFSDTLNFESNQYDVTPRLWLGFVGSSGLGARLRWWQFDNHLRSETQSFTFQEESEDIPAGTTLSMAGRLKMYTFDAEAMQRMDLGVWRTNVGAGLRYAGVEHGTGLGVVVPEEEAFGLRLGNQYYGVGPTAFAELRRPFGCHGLALVGTARGSLLYGTKRTTLAMDAIDGWAEESLSLSEKHEKAIFVGEVQLGLEWSRELVVGGQAFVHALWEGQLWGDLGGLAGLTGGDIGLMGFSFGAGIRR